MKKFHYFSEVQLLTWKLLFRFFKINLFICFWLRWVFVAARGLSLVVASRDYSVPVHRLLIAVLLPSTGSRCAGFSSCGAGA